MNSNGGVLENINKYFNTMIPYETQKKLGNFSEFLSSNTMIARGTFLLGILIFFSILFYIGSKVVHYFLSPSETPYLISGMKRYLNKIN